MPGYVRELTPDADAKRATPLRRWGFASMVSQAGLTLGLSAVIVRTFPSIGDGLRSLVVATVAINEVVGPIFFKLALERAGEVQS